MNIWRIGLSEHTKEESDETNSAKHNIELAGNPSQSDVIVEGKNYVIEWL